jgi:hypothetical protein
MPAFRLTFSHFLLFAGCEFMALDTPRIGNGRTDRLRRFDWNAS